MKNKINKYFIWITIILFILICLFFVKISLTGKYGGIDTEGDSEEDENEGSGPIVREDNPQRIWHPSRAASENGCRPDQEGEVAREACGDSCYKCKKNSKNEFSFVEIYENDEDFVLCKTGEQNICQEKCKSLGKTKLKSKYSTFNVGEENTQVDLNSIKGECIKDGDSYLGEIKGKGFTYKTDLSPLKQDLTSEEYNDIISGLQTWYSEERRGFIEKGGWFSPDSLWDYQDRKVWFNIRNYDINNEADDYCDEKTNGDYDCICSASLLCPDFDKDHFANENGIPESCSDNEFFDCLDSNSAIRPNVKESYNPAPTETIDVCSDKLDNNCNNLVDCDEPECADSPNCFCTPKPVNEAVQAIIFDGLVYQVQKVTPPILGANRGAIGMTSIRRGIILDNGKLSQDNLFYEIKVSVVMYLGLNNALFRGSGSLATIESLRENLREYLSEKDLDEIDNLIWKNFVKGEDILVRIYKDKLDFRIGSSVQRTYLLAAPVSDYVQKQPNPSPTIHNSALFRALCDDRRKDDNRQFINDKFELVAVTCAGQQFYRENALADPCKNIKEGFYDAMFLKYYENTGDKIAKAIEKYNKECVTNP